jgi:GNAT superfamily N-acetyltransferase
MVAPATVPEQGNFSHARHLFLQWADTLPPGGKPALGHPTMIQEHTSIAFDTLPPLALLENLGADLSGLLFDLEYSEDLMPYLVGHRRLKQIQQHPALLVYADPPHCDGDLVLSRVRGSLASYPRLADDRWDDIGRLKPVLDAPGYVRSADGRDETHHLVLFSAAAPTDPLGFLVLRRHLSAEPQAMRIDIDFAVDLLYVLPEYRTLGYGTALCVAAGTCCGWEVRHQVERYANRLVTLSPRLRADPLTSQHPRLTYAMEAKVQGMMDRHMEAPLAHSNLCLEALHR